jgi:zinc transporter, ZIP family
MELRQIEQNGSRQRGRAIALALLALLLGALLILLVMAGTGLGEQAGPPVEALSFTRIALPRPGMIVVDVANSGPDPLTIAQVLVDNAYWEFAVAPANQLPRFGHATISIPYPWVQGEPHRIVLLTSSGATFEDRVAAAAITPAPGIAPFWRYTLLAISIGVVLAVLGLLLYRLRS